MPHAARVLAARAPIRQAILRVLLPKHVKEGAAQPRLAYSHHREEGSHGEPTR